MCFGGRGDWGFRLKQKVVESVFSMREGGLQTENPEDENIVCYLKNNSA
jgi:hypothetical protein